MLADLDRLRAQASKKPVKAKKTAPDSPAPLSPGEKAEKAAKESLATLIQQLQVDWGQVQHRVQLMRDEGARDAAGDNSLAAFDRVCIILADEEGEHDCILIPRTMPSCHLGH